MNADIEDLSTERGHRTLAIVRKGGSHVTIPIAQPSRHLHRVHVHRWSDTSGLNHSTFVSVCNTLVVLGELFDLDRLEDTDPFEIDRQAAHLFKHDPYGIEDIYEVWNSHPLF